MAGNQMAGEGASHTTWMQDEALVRYNLPAHMSQLLCGVPSQLQRSDDQHREEVEEYLRTIERLRKRNEDLEGVLGAREAELGRLQATLYPAKSGLLLKLSGKPTSPEETKALLRDLENARLRAQTNEATIQNLEKTLKRYQDRIRYLETRDKKADLDGGFPLRYRDKSLDLSALVEQAALHDSALAALAQASEGSLQILANRVSPLPEDLTERLADLKAERVKLRAEPYTQKSYTPQEGAEKTSINLTNSAAKEDLLRRQEALRNDLLARWSDWQLAELVAKQREDLATAAANARISANEHAAAPEDRKEIENIEGTGELAGLSEAPALEKTFALGEQLLRLSLAHQKILSRGQSTEPGQADWEKLEAAQQNATNQSEETLEHILHESGKPKDTLTALQTRRTKLRAGAPSRSAHSVALMELQGDHEKAKRDVFDQTGVRMQQLTGAEQDAQNRLRKTLEESENSLATLADLASRDSPAARLAEERAAAQSLDRLLALEEEHQALRTQYIRDLPHLLITKGTLASVFDSLKALRADLKAKLKAAQQSPALATFSASDPNEAEAERLLGALSLPSSKEAKEQQLYGLHDQLVILLKKQLEAQGAGFVAPEESSKAALGEQWEELLKTIDGLVGLLAEAFHKLTIDDPTTKADLENILDVQKQLTKEEKDFPAGFAFANDIIEACKRMLGDTNNLTDVIEKLRDVDDSLIKFQQIMQDNYYKLKPVVGTEEVPGRRRGGRATTFLHITYAEPTNPKEGINILQEMIGTLKKNTDNLFEIESKRVQVVENSLNIKKARDGLQLLQEIEKEEKALRSEDVDVLKASPQAGEAGDQAATLAIEGLEPLEQIPNYAESITFFLKQVMPWLEKSLLFDRALNGLIKKVGVPQAAAAEVKKDPSEAEEGFEVILPADQIKGANLPSRNRPKKTKSGRPPASGAAPEEAEIKEKSESEGPVLLPESLQPAVEKLDIDIEGVFYENQLIIEELLRLFPTHPMAQEAEQLKKQHEEVWTHFPDAGDVRKTSATAELLVEWMPKERALLSKLHPQAEDPEEEEGKRGGGMGKSQRQKVKAGRPAAGKSDPFKTVKEQQDKLLTDMANLTTDAEADPADLPTRLQAAVSDYKEDDPISSMEQRQLLLDEGLSYLIEYYPAKIEELTEMITSLETTVTEKEQTVVTVQDDRAAEELVRLKKDMKVKETLLKELQEEVKDLRASKDRSENSEEQRYKLDKELKAAKSELEENKKKLIALTQENQTLQTQKVGLERSAAASTSSASQISHLEKIKTELETTLNEQRTQHKAISDKLLADIEAKEGEIARLQAELSSSQSSDGEYLRKYQYQLQKRVMMTLGTTLKFDKASSWLVWKLRTVKKYQAGFSMPAINWTFVSPIPDPAPTDKEPANAYMSEAARRGVEDGPLYLQFKSTDGQRERPLGMVTALGLMNEIRKRKTQDDREQLGNGKRPPGFPEFLVDYCIAKSGSQSEGASLCNRMLLALDKMHKQRHSLATFYVRLIRVYHFAPIPYTLSLSILQIAETFAPLATARANALMAQGLAPADEDQTGGEAALVPVMDLVLNLFEGQPAVSRLVLQGLQGDLLEPVEYLKLKLALGLRKTNSSVNKLFGAAPNSDKTGFSTLLIGALPQIFGQLEAEQLFSALTKAPTLTKAEATAALAKINLDELSNNNQLVVSLGVFLLAIADTYHYLLRDYVLNAQNLLGSFGWKTVTLENFNQLVSAAGVKASPAAIQSWYDEARGSQPTLTAEGALATLWKFPLTLGQPLVPAELSAAAVIMLLQETTTRKTITTVTTVTKKVKVIKKK